MKAIIITTSIGSFGRKGFYNLQEVGLAKALDKYFDQVDIFKAVDKNAEEWTEKIEGTNNAVLHLIPSKHFGNNGFIDLKVLPTDINVVINCADTQFFTPKVYQWAKKYNIIYLPYIGVTESHSGNPAVRLLTNMMFMRNLSVYKKVHCLVKTPAVEEDLHKKGVNHISVTPVSLDISLMKSDYAQYDKIELRAKYHLNSNNKVLLFIGRLIEQKQPLKMLEIFQQLLQKDDQYRLIMVGTGEQKEAVEKKIVNLKLKDHVRLIEKIPNTDIWELYRISDCFVNLNKQEIFGMAIMEAMYYNCKVVALNAPGPCLIIENGKSGFLAESIEEIEKLISCELPDSSVPNERVKEHFSWNNMALEIVRLIS